MCMYMPIYIHKYVADTFCVKMPDLVTLLYDINFMYCYKTFITVINEPDDATVCEGESTTFTCVLTSNVDSSAVQWYRLIDDSTTAMVAQDSNIHFTISTTNSAVTTNLTITNATKSYAGYYWVRLPSGDVCNVSLTVTTSMWIKFNMHLCICIYSYVAIYNLAN